MTSDAATELLDAPPWTIRPEQPIDMDQIHELHRAAFRGAAEAELVDAVRRSAGFVPDLSLVAVLGDGSVLGHIMISRVALHLANDGGADAPEERDVLALAPLAVLPPHQGRGIGSALVGEALEIADTRGEPFVVVLGAPDYYARFGFQPADEFGVSGPYEVPPEAYRLRPRPGLSDVPTGRVVYPPAFADV